MFHSDGQFHLAVFVTMMMSFLFTFVFEQKTTEEIVKAGHPLKPTAKIVDALFEPMIACTSMEKNELK